MIVEMMELTRVRVAPGSFAISASFDDVLLHICMREKQLVNGPLEVISIALA